MTARGDEPELEPAEPRRVVYALIPPELAPKLHDLLRRHFRDEPGVEAIVERRERERRSAGERREGDWLAALGEPGEGEAEGERRQVRVAGGRRLAERRAPLRPVKAPPLPRRARPHAERIVFVVRLEPATEDLEDLDTARLIARIQAGERDLFGDIYARYYDRVYGYMKVALRNAEEAEDATQQVFVDMLEAMPRYERRTRPFRSWLFTIVRNTAIKQLRRERRLEFPGDEALAQEGSYEDPEDPDELSLTALDWITDRDLLLFVERLPLAQRQVLVLRFMLGMSGAEIAHTLGRTPEAVRAQQSRALRFLRARLEAIGRGPRSGKASREDRIPSLAPIRPQTVLRERRFGLTNPGPR